MRIIFMGTPSYATEILKEILPFHEIVALFTQPDKPVGRKKVLTPPHIKDLALKNGCEFPIFQPKTLKDEKIIKNIKELKPDIIIVAAYGMILTKSVLEICPCINLHASILPKFRGASPIQQSILQNETYSGVTAMRMDIGLDTGDMLGFSYVKLEEKTTSEELFETLSTLAAKLTVKVLKDFENIEPIKQLDALSSYAPKIIKANGEVDVFTMSAKEIYTRFKGYFPWPGVYFPNGVKLTNISHESGDGEAGIIKQITKNEVKVYAKSGTLVLHEVCPPSKKPMSAYSYIMGKRLEVDDRIY